MPEAAGQLHQRGQRPVTKTSPISLKSLNWTVLATVVIQLSAFGSGIILARSLGANGRGFVAAAMIWPPLLVSLVTLGVGEAVMFRSARSESAVARVLSTAIFVGLGQSIVAVAIGWFLMPKLLGQMPADVIAMSRAYLALIPLTLTTLCLTAVLQARGYRFNLVRTAVHVAYTGVLLLLWLSGSISPLRVVLASLLAAAADLSLAVILVSRRGWLHPKASLHEARALLSFGSRVHVGTIASILSARLDLVILAALVPAADLGNYAIGAAAGSALTLLPFSASLAVYPAVVRMQRDAVPVMLARCLALIALLILLAVVVALALPFAIPLLFGPGFTSAVLIGQILTFGITIRGSTGLLGAILRGISRPLAAGVGDLAALPILAVALLFMVPTWRGVGAAIALSIAASVGFVVILGLCMRSVGMKWMDVGALWQRDAERARYMVRRRSALAVR
jgi:O-antigen/teichoic acid export membrane protein